jgi:hypothetical protein
MTAQRDVVVVQRMGGGAVDPGRVWGRAALGGEVQRRLPGAAVAQRLAQDLHRGLHAAGDHGADAVDEPGARDLQGRLRHLLELEIRDEAAKRLGEGERLCVRHGLSSILKGHGSVLPGILDDAAGGLSRQ